MAPPIRTCIGCGDRREKQALIRLTARGGLVAVDTKGGSPGRGAYVCGSACLVKALSQQKLGRAFKARVTAGEALMAQIRSFEAAKN